MEEACFSETSVSTYKTTRCHNLQDQNLNNHSFENLKTRIPQQRHHRRHPLTAIIIIIIIIIIIQLVIPV
jgi:hypothetical protein